MLQIKRKALKTLKRLSVSL